MVQLANAAWHAMHYPNMIGIGIEMVDRYMVGGYLTRGCMSDPSWFTTVQLQTVANLVATLMQEFNIPIAKVMGHNNPWLRQFGNNHQDPGPAFPWQKFGQLVQAALAVPSVPVAPEPIPLTTPKPFVPRKQRGRPPRKNRIYE
jgi:N-acetyl-anhydromuramyl-L-alanine amidase AmpD